MHNYSILLNKVAEKMKWSDLKRSSDVILAVWPYYRPHSQQWILKELVYMGNLAPKWRDRLFPDAKGNVYAAIHANQEAAISAANKLNPELRLSLYNHLLNPVERRSIELKIDKALQAKSRIQEEEALMLAEALRRHARTERPCISLLKIVPDAEQFRDDLAEQLIAMPYLQVARVGQSRTSRNHYILYRSPKNVWSMPQQVEPRNAQVAERAKIANGFDLAGETHWGETKAKIRNILLPRANQLLQLASVKRLLAEAFARGERVLVSNGIVFWYEDDGIGWQVKQTSSSTQNDEGETIWKEGTIVSTNHGRLVVLPYTKENGEKVKGHTKNGPKDGRALPRHPDDYLEIPFSLYDGDLMIGLFGELPYE